MNFKYIISKLAKANFAYLNRIRYFNYYKKCKIKDNIIFIEPQQGRTINGSMFYFIKELSSNIEYNSYWIYVALKKESIKDANAVLAKNGIENIKIIVMNSLKYYKTLATAKYLITDTSFPTAFIKKEGQKILNTWHGTPLKYLGKKAKSDYYKIGNVQKNFFISDYLLYPNEYTKEHLIEDYMLENISSAKTILAGYPRNTAFFDKDSEKNIRNDLNLNDKEIFVYMPTWRDCVTEDDIEKNKKTMLDNLTKIEKGLKENQILYVNLHPLDKKNIDFSQFNKIREFPKEYETYQFLNIANCLITDYSSVFFDFAITKKKIILFCYDEEEYLKSRGLYFDFRELPFTKVKNIEELLKEVNCAKNYDDSEFIKKFCKYDSFDVTAKLCKKFILNEDVDLPIKEIKNNGKDNVLIYVGNLDKNGITSSLRNLLNNIDINAKNYYLTFSANKIEKNKEQLLTFPDGVKYISTMGNTNMKFIQKIELNLYRMNWMPQFIINKLVKNVYPYEIKRLYGNIKFNTVIQFGGYEYRKILLFSEFNCNKIIYVHSDMEKEIKLKNNQHRKTLKYAYNNYDKVAIVTEGMRDSVYSISHKNDNIYVANNIINYKSIIERGKDNEVSFNEKTECTVSLEELNDVLNSKNKKFITIGRFSPEKGHARLIKAFEKIYLDNNSVYLIIIGGVGKEYENTIKIAQESVARKNIILIKNITNPYTILKKCDYFVLSSYYEGFGLVVAEANILGKPVISTDLPGIRDFMQKNKGKLVENSENGIYSGMQDLLNNKVEIMQVDYEAYNKNAIEEFYKLFN